MIICIKTGRVCDDEGCSLSRRKCDLMHVAPDEERGEPGKAKPLPGFSEKEREESL